MYQYIERDGEYHGEQSIVLYHYIVGNNDIGYHIYISEDQRESSLLTFLSTTGAAFASCSNILKNPSIARSFTLIVRSRIRSGSTKFNSSTFCNVKRVQE